MFLCRAYTGYGQDTRIFYNNAHEKITDSASAYYYRICKLQDNGFYKIEERYIKNDGLRRSCTFNSLDSEQKEGGYVLYSDSGYKLEEGNYLHGVKDGKWHTYYYNSAQVHYVCDYKKGLSDGYLTSFYKNGVLKRREKDANSERLTAQCFDEAGKEIPCTDFMAMARPGYSIYGYLATHLTYPRKAKRKRIQGHTVISFVVDTDGSIHNAHITVPLGGGCDQEALREIAQMPRWLPATLDGEPIQVSFSQPVTFWLEGAAGSAETDSGSAKPQEEHAPRVIKEVNIRSKNARDFN